MSYPLISWMTADECRRRVAEAQRAGRRGAVRYWRGRLAEAVAAGGAIWLREWRPRWPEVNRQCLAMPGPAGRTRGR